jgi:uncharacterized protein YbaR (Trm112 family)
VHPFFLDHLQCPAPHAPGPLVAAADRRRDRALLDGTLGCPLCRRDFPVRDGIARFGDEPAPKPVLEPADDEALMRLGAMLDLVTPGGGVALAPAWAPLAAPLAHLQDVQVLQAAPPSALVMGEGLSGIDGTRSLPLAPGTLRGVALDSWVASAPAALASWVAAVKSGGRVCGPVDVPVPDGVEALASDASHWVGRRTASQAGPPVPLRRAAAAERP